MNTKTFGKIIEEGRIALGWSQAFLAEKSGVSQASVSRIENDTQTNLLEETKNALLVALGINAVSIPEKHDKPIPVISWVHAGLFAECVDVWPVGISGEEEPVFSRKVTGPNAFALRIVGDSMEPRYMEGDIIVVDPALSCDSGCPCVVWLNGEVSFKIFKETKEEIRLCPLNDKYEQRVIRKGSKADFKVIGKVVDMIPNL